MKMLNILKDDESFPRVSQSVSNGAGTWIQRGVARLRKTVKSKSKCLSELHLFGRTVFRLLQFLVS